MTRVAFSGLGLFPILPIQGVALGFLIAAPSGRELHELYRTEVVRLSLDKCRVT